MLDCLNDIKDACLIDSNGNVKKLKEIWYITGAIVDKVWPGDTYAKEIALYKLSSDGVDLNQHFEVLLSGDGSKTTYRCDGKDYKGLPPGYYAVVAEVVRSSKEIADKTQPGCWCTLVNVTDGTGNQIKFWESTELFSSTYSKKRNPFTMMDDSFTVIEITKEDPFIEQYKYPTMVFKIGEPNAGEPQGFVVGNVSGSNTAPLRIIRETPTYSFQVKNSEGNVITSGMKIEDDIMLYPKYTFKWSDGVSTSYDATLELSSSTAYNGFVGYYNNKLSVHKNPIGKNMDIVMNLKYGSKTGTFNLVLKGKEYRLKVGSSYYYPGDSFTISNATQLSVYYRWYGGGNNWYDAGLGYTSYKVTGNTAKMNYSQIVPVGYGSNTLTVTVGTGQTLSWTVNAIAQLKWKLLKNGNLDQEGSVKPETETPETIQIFSSGTYRIEIYQGNNKISYVATVRQVQNASINGTWSPNSSVGSTSSEIGGTFYSGSSLAVTYGIVANNIAGWVQLFIMS